MRTLINTHPVQGKQISNRNGDLVDPVSEDDSFWFIKEKGTVWAEVIGFNRAAHRMLTVLGNPKDDTYYEEKKDKIHTFFKPHSVPKETIKAFCLPIQLLERKNKQEDNDIVIDSDDE